MRTFCNILLLLFLSNIIHSQEHSVSENVINENSDVILKYNLCKNVGIGEFANNINHSFSIGFGVDCFLYSRLSIETGLLISYKNLFHGKSYRLEIFCPTCDPSFTNAEMKTTSLISLDIPIIFSYTINSNKKMLVSLGVNNSYNAFYYQRIDKSYFSYRPLLYGKISRYDLMFLLGISKNISKFNIGLYLCHNIQKLMKYNSLEELNNANINDVKIYIHGLTPSYYKYLSLRIKYYLNFK